MKATLDLTSTMMDLLAQADEKTRQLVAGCIVEAAESIAHSPPCTPDELAASLHREIDHHVALDIQEQAIAPEIRCSAGCSHCCKQVVAITPDEAQLLLAAAERNGVEINRERLQRQRGMDDAAWLTLTGTDRDCIFLDTTGRCTVYDDRPMSCRKYFSLDPPDLCNIERYPSQDIKVWFSATAEVIASAAFTQRGCGFMADQLLTILEGRDRRKD